MSNLILDILDSAPGALLWRLSPAFDRALLPRTASIPDLEACRVARAICGSRPARYYGS